MNLKEELEHLIPGVEQSPWRNHEHDRGYGVFGFVQEENWGYLNIMPEDDADSS